MRHILLATIGASPQVLTETLFAIHQSGKPFPEEVFVITTADAKPTLMNGLFRDGHLQALKDEYSLPSFLFDETSIWVMEDDSGCKINDAKTIEDQTVMADFITRKVFELTQDPNVAVHGSLAGGRKTMSFYFGYAMSLYGREQDTLSHVFVNDAYEFVRDFWFPTKSPKWVTGKNGQGELDLSKAEVTLAEIPFVRMRNSVDPSLLASMANFSFSQTVAMLNASHHKQLIVKICQSAQTIDVLGVEVRLTAKELAFYVWLLDKGEQGMLVDRYFEDDTSHSIAFLTRFSALSTDPRVFESLGTTPEDFAEGNSSNVKGMEKTFLQPICSYINRKLKKALPAETASKLGVCSLQIESAQRYLISLSESEFTVNVS